MEENRPVRRCSVLHRLSELQQSYRVAYVSSITLR